MRLFSSRDIRFCPRWAYLVVAMAICALGTPALAAFDMFLSVPGVPGESTDKTYKDQIDVISYSHNITMPASTGGVVTPLAVHQPFRIVKYVDRASPLLSQSVCSGVHYTTVTLSVTKETEGNPEVIEYQLGDATVASVSVDGLSSATRLTEVVGFSYSRIRWTFFHQSEKGVMDGTIVRHWDTKVIPPTPGPTNASEVLLRME
jgi:type VI secretion system secreted protein Hcp